MHSPLVRACAFSLLFLANPAHAQRTTDGLTLDQVLPEIRAEHPGQLSDARTWTDQEGHAHYRVKWITAEGRVLYFDVDTSTGQYTETAGDTGE